MKKDISILIFELDISPFVILLEGFSWVIPYLSHPARSGSESAKDLPVSKKKKNATKQKVFICGRSYSISFIAAFYHPLSIAFENRSVFITGMKLWYCLHRSRSSVYTVAQP
jgi:hypothetical protein